MRGRAGAADHYGAECFFPGQCSDGGIVKKKRRKRTTGSNAQSDPGVRELSPRRPR